MPLTESSELGTASKLVMSVEDAGLTGAQDAAISGLVNTATPLVLSALYRIFHTPKEPGSSSFGMQLQWWPTTHLECWLALFGGACAFCHDFFLLRAFEGAPSTVLLPLIQVASVSVLLGSSVVALYRGEQWISLTHAGAYALMFVGGLLPATGGDVSRLLGRSFWQQRFVAFAVLSELSYGLHDLLASAVSYDAGHAAHGGPGPDFFVWSRTGYVATFVGLYGLLPSLNAELRQLATGWRSGAISRLTLAVSGLSELLALCGYYLMSRALSRFYQPAIVHAAEASLSQLLNLGLAFVALRACGVGRPSAVGSMRAKLLSFLLVTAGLLACTLEDESHTVAAGAMGGTAAATWRNASAPAAPLAPYDPNADFYAQYRHYPMALPVKYGQSWRQHRQGGGGRASRRRARKARHDFFFHDGPQ